MSGKRLNVNDVISFKKTNKEYIGVIKYIGLIYGLSKMSQYCGVDLIQSIGNEGHSGTIHNYSYFITQKGYGTHCKLTQVKKKLSAVKLFKLSQQSLRQKNTEISNLQKRITIATNAKCKKSLPCTPNSPDNISNKYSNPVQLKLTNNITNCSRMSALFDGPTTPLSNMSFSPKLPFKDSPSNVSTTLRRRNDTLSPSNVPRMTRNDTLSPSNVTMMSGNTSVSVTTVDNTVYNSKSIASLFSGNSSEDFGSFPDTEPIPANVNQKRTKFTIEPHIIKVM